MGQYLDSDAARRQSETVLRLTVVTILGLVGTIATGFLGMNLIDETSQPLHMKVLYFVAVTIPAVALTLYTLQKSGPLSEFIDAMSNERLSPRQKLASFRRVFRGNAPDPRVPARAARPLQAKARAPRALAELEVQREREPTRG